MPRTSRPPILAAYVVVALAAFCPRPGAAQPSASLSLEPSGKVGVDEYLQLTVRVESPPRDFERPELSLENLELQQQSPSQSTSVQFVNGVSSHSLSLTWIVKPQRLGPARVHSASIRLGGETYELDDATVEVVEDPPPRGRDARDPFDRRGLGSDPFDSFFSRRPWPRQRREVPPPEIFLRAEVTPKRPRPGEQVLYTLYLFTDVNVRSVTPTSLPDFKGFWARVIPQPEDTRPEMVVHEGREIGRVVLLQRALFPRRSGRLEIEPVAATMAAVMRDPNSRFGSIIPRMGEIERTSNAVEIDVQPLPEPHPNGFQGLVGRFELEASLEPRTLERGEAATLVLRLRGEGHLQGAPAPTLPALEDLRVFPPQETSDSSLRGTRVRGERTWSYVLVPGRPGTVELSAIEVPYFDPRAGEYRVARAEIPPLEVHGSTRPGPTDVGGVELHGIRDTALPAPEPATETFGPWRHAALLTPLALAAILLFWRHRTSGSGTGAARRRLLETLRDAAREERPRRAAAVAEDAWRAYLEERWQIAPGAASTRWAEELVARGVAPEVADELVHLADDLHYLRYAPKLSSTENLRDELVERSRRLVRSL